MKRILLLIPLLVSACGSVPVTNPATQPTVEQIKNDIYWLADDAREGRLPGTAGADAAANYIAERFKSLGLAPSPDSGAYLQSFELPGKTTIGKSTSLHINGQPQALDKDFRPLAFSAEARFEGKVAFVGYGVSSEKHEYDDYTGIDVKDRVVIAMRYEPHDAKGKSRFGPHGFTPNAHIDRKAQVARSKGAKAVLLVNPPTHHPGESPLRPFVPVGARFDVAPVPVLSVTPEVAEKLLGRKIEDLQKQIDESAKPASFLVDAPLVRGEVDLDVQKTRTTNVIGVLPGVGAKKDEYIVVGAHYDHIGHGTFGSRKPGSGEIHNGADDNASGTAAVLGIARELSNHRLQRSVLFVAFSGEESGLLGSSHFVKHSPVPLENIVAMINLDMVGRIRSDTLFVGGGGTRASFRKLLTDADDASDLKLKSIGEGGLGPSDHQSFAVRKIPVLFFFSGLHRQYHHPDDDAKLINFDGVAETVELVTGLVEKIAAADREQYVSKFDSAGMRVGIDPTSQPTTQSTHTGSASLGVIPDYGSDQSTGGVRIGGTVPNSPAAGAGLADGDILVGWNDKPIDNLYDLTDFLRQSSPGDEVKIDYTRAGKRESVRVKLAARNAN